MASVRLSRVCCPLSDSGTELVRWFHAELYNWLCLASSLLGLCGAALCYPRGGLKRTSGPIRLGGRIRLCSMLASAGILLSSILWLSVPNFLSNQKSWPAHTICVLITTWIHYFCSVQFWAFFCYSLEVVQLLSPSPTERLGGLYMSLCWGGPSLLCLHGLLVFLIPEDSCTSASGVVLFHDIVVYIPYLLALLVSPLLLRRAICAVPTVLRMQCGVYTCSERSKKHSLCRRFLRINSTFIACWLGNMFCDFWLFLLEVWGGPRRHLQVAALTMWVIMGILNPMYCFLHSLAFFGCQCTSESFVKKRSTGTDAITGADRIAGVVLDLEGEVTGLMEEEHPLLMVEPAQTTGKLYFPNVLQLMHSWTSVGISCSAVEINAVRLLGTCDTGSSLQASSKPSTHHSDVNT